MANQHTRGVLTVSDEQRQELERWLRRTKTPHVMALRARIILQSAQGRSDLQVADNLHTTRVTVGKWRKRFLAQGCDGLWDAPRSGAPRTVTDADMEEVVARTLQTRPPDGRQWTRESMAQVSGLSPSTVGRIWRAFGLQPHRTETLKLSQDLRFVEKVRDIVGLYVHPPDRAVVFCVEQQSPLQALDRSERALPLRPGGPDRPTRDDRRNGPTSLFAALDIATGEMTRKGYRRNRAVEFKRFLALMDRSVPETHEVHVVLDNDSTAKTALIRNWLSERPRYHLHFTPTRAAWLNQVERCFAAITQQRLRRGAFRSTVELEAAIQEYSQADNEAPQPFIWAKSADDVLKSLESYSEGMAGAEH